MTFGRHEIEACEARIERILDELQMELQRRVDAVKIQTIESSLKRDGCNKIKTFVTLEMGE